VRKPLVLIDTGFWGGLIDWFRMELGSRQMIDLHNTDFIQVVDDHVDALKILLK
jgi:predicted Rossmann-fold nucleotide-binding protein